MLKVLDLFSGIGGFSLGLDQTGGFRTVAFCESDPYCRKVLTKHWPGIPIHRDVRHLDGKKLRGTVDVITGGFPCQDISTAGKRAGLAGERSGLWSEFARLIGEIRPAFAVVENVPMLLAGDRGRWFGRVLGDLAEIWYDCEWHCIPAAYLGAPHRRDRVWLLAHNVSDQLWDESRRRDGQDGTNEAKSGNDGASQLMADAPRKRRNGARNARTPRRAEPPNSDQIMPNTFQQRLERKLEAWAEARAINGPGDGCHPAWWVVEPDVGRVADGIPARVDRLRCLGNAIVPQMAALIGEAILASSDQ